jgi:hypothetical protein
VLLCSAPDAPHGFSCKVENADQRSVQTKANLQVMPRDHEHTFARDYPSLLCPEPARVACGMASARSPCCQMFLTYPAGGEIAARQLRRD